MNGNQNISAIMMKELPDEIYAAVKRLSAEGDARARHGDNTEAIERYRAAWDLLPAPRGQWLAATWLLAAIGDAHYLAGEYFLALSAFTDAIRAPHGLGNAFLHLRRGQCLFEIGEKTSAADELMRAYMGGGPEILRAEDPKYLEYLRSVAIL